MTRLLLFLIVCIGFAIGLASCKREKCHDPFNKDCDNYDPCYGQNPVKAEIEISQFFDASSHPDFKNVGIVEDKFIPGYIQFNCPVPNAKCTWTLGAETITLSKFKRGFSDTLPKGTYTVRLIIQKEPNKACFPNDDGIDTLIKTFELVKTCELLVKGVFKGVWEGDKDSSVFSIRFFDPSNPKDTCYYNSDCLITNVRKLNDTIVLSRGETYISNSTLSARGNWKFDRLDMIINTKTLAAELQYQLEKNDPIRKFKGRRIAD